MITLNRPYQGYVAGTIVQLTTAAEAALIAQGLATTSAGPVTPGAVNSGQLPIGRVGIAAAAISVVVTSPVVTTESRIYAYISQAAADVSAFQVVRVVPAAGSFTIFLNAAATAAVQVDWVIVSPVGLTANS